MADNYTNTRRFLAPFATVTGKVQWLGIIILMVMIVLAIFAPLISGYAPDQAVCDPFAKPSSDHILGCDDAGHDLLSQLLFGARVSLFVGLSVALRLWSVVCPMFLYTYSWAGQCIVVWANKPLRHV